MFYIFLSPYNNPFENQAFEQFIIENFSLSMVLILYQNVKTVSIGRHQNPWKECNPEILKKEGIFLTRRLSGGGAVFQDSYNLNYSFIGSSKFFNVDNNYEIIQKSVKNFGIDLVKKNKTDLFYKNKKVSGNAFYYKKGLKLHHGTLLIKSNLDQLKKFLTPKYTFLDSDGIDSRRSEVINLNDIVKNIDILDIRDSIVEYFLDIYKESKHVEYQKIVLNPQFERCLDRFRSFEWIYSNTPKFNFNGIKIDPSKWKVINDIESIFKK